MNGITRWMNRGKEDKMGEWVDGKVDEKDERNKRERKETKKIDRCVEGWMKLWTKVRGEKRSDRNQ